MKKLKKKFMKNTLNILPIVCGLLVQEYKRRGGTYIGNKNEKEGLARWMKEKWINQRGEVGYKYKSDVYRPTVKVSERHTNNF
jgi:hypothetical protein